MGGPLRECVPGQAEGGSGGDVFRSRQVAMAFALLLLGAVMAAACGGSSGGGGGRPDQHVSVSLSDNGCTPSSFILDTGTVVFTVSNVHSSKVNTFAIDRGGQLMGEATNVLGGLSRELTIDLPIGDYTVHCTGGGAGGSGTLTVR